MRDTPIVCAVGKQIVEGFWSMTTRQWIVEVGVAAMLVKLVKLMSSPVDDFEPFQPRTEGGVAVEVLQGNRDVEWIVGCAVPIGSH